MQNFALTAASAYILSELFGIKGVWFGFLCGECLTLLFIVIYVTVKNNRFGITADSFSLLPESYGVKDDDCLEVSLTNPDEVVTASVAVSLFCKEHGAGSKLSSLIALTVEEMANNIVKHGFDKEKRENSIDIRLIFKKGEPILRIRDNCRHFDPVKYTELHSSDDPVSHIGIRMVMKLVKSANYVNSMGLNNLTLTF